MKEFEGVYEVMQHIEDNGVIENRIAYARSIEDFFGWCVKNNYTFLTSKGLSDPHDLHITYTLRESTIQFLE